MQAKPLALDQQHLLKSQLSSLQLAKELAETQLKQAQAQVADLERENANLEREVERARGTVVLLCIAIYNVLYMYLLSIIVKVRSLEESAQKDQEKITELQLTHIEEVAQIKRDKGEQLKEERERLLNQIRELTITKEKASAEVQTQHYVLHDASMCTPG